MDEKRPKSKVNEKDLMSNVYKFHSEARVTQRGVMFYQSQHKLELTKFYWPRLSDIQPPPDQWDEAYDNPGLVHTNWISRRKGAVVHRRIYHAMMLAHAKRQKDNFPRFIVDPAQTRHYQMLIPVSCYEYTDLEYEEGERKYRFRDFLTQIALNAMWDCRKESNG
jgi:hypothetical protein